MKPDNKKDQWKKLLENARRSKQLSRMKRNTQLLKDASKNLSTKNQSNLKSQSSLTSDDAKTVQLNQTTNSLIVSEQMNSISRLNNLPLDEMVDRIFENLMEIKRKNEKQQCRICHSNIEEQLFEPCDCKGTMSHVHRTCLCNWIKSNRSKRCNICLTKYRNIQITFQYPSVYKWLIKDIDTMKNFLLFLFLYSTSFMLYARRASSFYLSEYRSYEKETILVDNNLVDNLESNDLAKLKFSKINRHFKEMSYQISSVSSSLSSSCDYQTNCLNNSLFNHHCLTDQQSQCASILSIIGDKKDANRLEKHTYSVTIYTYLILIYLFNDLAVIFMYEIVFFTFFLYFRKEFLLWKIENRTAEIEFL